MQTHNTTLMLLRAAIDRNVALIKHKTNDFTPKLGIILGSGLGPVAEQITQPITIDYEYLSYFPECNIEGHHGQLYLGHLNSVPVVCLQGRGHLYENISPLTLPVMIRTLKKLGCETLLLTNSAGSLHHDLLPGELMLIHDHINFQFTNSLVGMQDDEYGSMFFGMENAYDPALREQILRCAHRLNLPLRSGVYLSVLGPSFETPAEIRAFRILGADLVGMSTVPEVLLARHCGLRVLAVSAVTNLAAGMHHTQLSHQVTLDGAAVAIPKLSQLILEFTKEFSHAK